MALTNECKEPDWKKTKPQLISEKNETEPKTTVFLQNWTESRTEDFFCQPHTPGRLSMVNCVCCCPCSVYLCLCMLRLHQWYRWLDYTGVITLVHLTSPHRSSRGQVIANILLWNLPLCQPVKHLAWIHRAHCYLGRQVTISVTADAEPEFLDQELISYRYSSCYSSCYYAFWATVFREAYGFVVSYRIEMKFGRIVL